MIYVKNCAIRPSLVEFSPEGNTLPRYLKERTVVTPLLFSLDELCLLVDWLYFWLV